MIAATAIRHGFFLATRNGADLHHLEQVLAVIDVTDDRTSVAWS